MFYSARTTAFSVVVRPAFSSPPCLARALEARSVSRYYRSRSAATFPVRVMRSKLVETSRGAVADVACTLLLSVLASHEASIAYRKKKRRDGSRIEEERRHVTYVYTRISHRDTLRHMVVLHRDDLIATFRSARAPYMCVFASGG